jgi:hypothetical protein
MKVMLTKNCSGCKTPKHIDEFSKSSKRKDGLQSVCKACSKDFKNAWRQGNKEKIFYNRLYSKYRLRREDYLKLLKKQNDSCATCFTTFSEIPCIDHDHACCKGERSCGKCVRGLLCQKCNKILGWFEKVWDDQMVSNFKNYLEAPLE